MLLVVVLVGTTVFAILSDRESVKNVSGFGDDELRVSDFGSTEDGNLSLNLRNFDTESAEIAKVNVSSEEGDVTLSPSDGGSISRLESGSLRFCAENENFSADEVTIEVVYDTEQYGNIISEGELSGGISVESCKDTESSGSSSNPGEFLVKILSVNEPKEGEYLEVVAAVKNNGSGEATQPINLSVPDLSISNSTDITRTAGENTTETFYLRTAQDHNGTYTASVSSLNEAESTKVTIKNTETEFLVYTNGSNSPINEGDELRIDAVVENNGNIQNTKKVNLSVPGIGHSNKSVALDGGNQTELTLRLDTPSESDGTYTANVSTEDDWNTTQIEIQDTSGSSNFRLANLSSNSPVKEGNALEAGVEVENTGGLADTQNITLNISGLNEEEKEVQLDPDQKKDVNYTVSTSNGDAGIYDANFSSGNDTESVPVEIQSDTEATVVEGFEDGDLSGYRSRKHNKNKPFDDIDRFSVQNSKVYNGSYAMNGSTIEGYSFNIIRNESWRNLSQGDLFEFYTYLDKDSKISFKFGIVDDKNFYSIAQQPANNKLDFRRIIDGEKTVIKEKNFDLPTGKWIRTVVDWDQNGDIVVTMEYDNRTEITSIRVNDNTFQNGTIGWGTNSNYPDDAWSLFDNLRIIG
jgi:hypothetical protein